MLHFQIITFFWWTMFTKSVSLLHQGSPGLNAALQMSHQIWGKDHFPWCASNTVPNTSSETVGHCCRLAQGQLGTVIPSAFSKLTWTQASPFLLSAQASPRLQRLLPHHTLTSPCSTAGLAGGPAQLMAQDWLSSRERKQAFWEPGTSSASSQDYPRSIYTANALLWKLS